MDYSIKIRRAVNGIIIDVGCKKFVFNSIEEGLLGLRSYLVNQKDTIDLWKNRFPKDLYGATEDSVEITGIPEGRNQEDERY